MRLGLFILGSWLACGLPLAVQAEPVVELLTTGTFHGEKMAFAKDGEVWTSVVVTPEGSVAKRVPLNVTTVLDPMEDEEGGPLTGQEVSAEGEPLFLIRGLDIGEGVLPTYVPTQVELPRGSELKIAGPAGEWLLVASGEGDAYRLVLQGKGFTAEVMDVAGLDDTAPSVWWAGDVNGDGVPDMLLDVSKKYSNRILVMYVSEMGELGPVLRKVAVLDTVGC